MANTLPPAVQPATSGVSPLVLPRPRPAVRSGIGATPLSDAPRVVYNRDGDRITLNPPGDMTGVAMSGELDLATAPVLRAAVTAAIPRPHAPATPPVGAFLLDLAQVTFMDSAALHTLAEIRAQVNARGWTLGLIPPAAYGPRRLLLLAATLGWLPRW